MRMVFPSHASGRLMDDLATDVGTLVESFFGDVADRGGPPSRNRMAVPMDIDERDDAYLVTLDVPGVALDSIAIDIHEDTLTVAGQRDVPEKDVSEKAEHKRVDEDKSEPAAVKHLRRERAKGKFERKVQLPLPVEPDANQRGTFRRRFGRESAKSRSRERETANSGFARMMPTMAASR